jgi:hypothetical protein
MGLACTAGPEPPYYNEESFKLNVRVTDPAPEAINLGLDLDLIIDCHPAWFIDDADDDVPRLAAVGGGGVPLDASAAHLQVAVGGAPNGPPRLAPAGGQRCTNNRGQVMGVPSDPLAPFRYYRLTGTLYGPSAGGATPRVGPWLAVDREIVYSRWPVRLAPFGPAGGVLALPAGYSIVRRACGPAGGPMEVVREPMDTVIELRGSGVSSVPWEPPPEPVSLEPDAREFAQRCGISLPTVDLGARVSLDAARRVAWSPDQSRLYYLTGASETSGLRAVPSEGGATIELLGTPLGERLDVTSGGDVFVEEAHGFLRRGAAQPAGSMQFETLPIPSEAFAPAPRVSPDGRWIADPRFPERNAANAISIWDVAGKQEHTRIAGAATLGDWAPDSQRLWFRPFGGQDPTLSTWDVATGTVSELGMGDKAEWLDDGAIAIIRFVSTSVHEVFVLRPGSATQAFSFTLSMSETFHSWMDGRLVSLGLLAHEQRDVWTSYALTGVELQDPRAGRRSVVGPLEAPDFTQAVAVEGGALIWTRSCHDLHRALCFFQLHRIALPAGTDQVIAVYRDRPISALSPDRRRLAIGTVHGIFVKELP